MERTSNPGTRNIPASGPRKFLAEHSIGAYIVLAYLFTWGCWGIGLTALGGQFNNIGDPRFFPFFYAGSFGPTLAALIMTAVDSGMAGVRDLLGRLLRARQALAIYAVTFFLLPLVFLLGYLLLGVSTIQRERLPLETLALVLLMPINALSASILGIGPLGEEMGWRGFLLPRLLKRYSETTTNILLGTVWTFWHIPLFVFGDWRGGVDLIPFVVLYWFSIICITAMLTRLWRWSQGSLLIAILFHGVVNATTSGLADSSTWRIEQFSPLTLLLATVTLFGVAALIFTGLSRTLMRRFEHQRIEKDTLPMTKPTASRKQQPRSPWVFFALTFLVSWGVWIPMIYFKSSSFLLSLIGACGPLIAALILLYRSHDRAYRRSFWRRLTDPRLITLGGWLLLLITYPLIYILSILLSGRSIEISTIREATLNPASLGVVFFGLLGGPLVEEPGWRGVGLDRLQTRYGKIATSVIIGFFWALWHMPLYWVPIEHVAVPMKSSGDFWLITIGVNRFLSEISATFLLVWFVNRYRGSILAAIVLHFMSNNVPYFLGYAQTRNDFQPYVVLLQCILALFCAVSWLQGRRWQPQPNRRAITR